MSDGGGLAVAAFDQARRVKVGSRPLPLTRLNMAAVDLEAWACFRSGKWRVVTPAVATLAEHGDTITAAVEFRGIGSLGPATGLLQAGRRHSGSVT